MAGTLSKVRGLEFEDAVLNCEIALLSLARDARHDRLPHSETHLVHRGGRKPAKLTVTVTYED